MLKIRKSIKEYEKMSYIKDDAEENGEHENLIDCSHGINPYDCSDRISDYMDKLNIGKINSYPDYPYNEFRVEIAKYWADIADVNYNNIRLGNGSMDVMSTLNRIFIDNDTKILGYCPQFTEYVSEVISMGGEYDCVTLKVNDNLKFNTDEVIERMNSSHSLVYIDNPNNPTGQVISIDEIKKIAEKAEELNICLLVDEAYGDFMDRKNSAIGIVNEYSNIFVSRTFSKGIGLAGLRIGYMVCSDYILDYYRKVDKPFGLNEFGHVLARIALTDKEFITHSISEIGKNKKRFIRETNKLRIFETNDNVPIMVLMHPDENLDLQEIFHENGVLTESGEDFMGLGRNFVRLRIPKDIDGLIAAVERIETRIEI